MAADEAGGDRPAGRERRFLSVNRRWSGFHFPVPATGHGCVNHGRTVRYHPLKRGIILSGAGVHQVIQRVVARGYNILWCHGHRIAVRFISHGQMGFKLQFPDLNDIPGTGGQHRRGGDRGLIETDRLGQGFQAECLILPDNAALDAGDFAEAVLE